eukprot:4563469-Prymnesium_polylepis.1
MLVCALPCVRASMCALPCARSHMVAPMRVRVRWSDDGYNEALVALSDDFLKEMYINFMLVYMGQYTPD